MTEPTYTLSLTWADLAYLALVATLPETPKELKKKLLDLVVQMARDILEG